MANNLYSMIKLFIIMINFINYSHYFNSMILFIIIIHFDILVKLFIKYIIKLLIMIRNSN